MMMTCVEWHASDALLCEDSHLQIEMISVRGHFGLEETIRGDLHHCGVAGSDPWLMWHAQSHRDEAADGA